MLGGIIGGIAGEIAGDISKGVAKDLTNKDGRDIKVNTSHKFGLKDVGKQRHDLLRSCDGEIGIALSPDEHGAEMLDSFWSKILGRTFKEVLKTSSMFLIDFKTTVETEPELIQPVGYHEFYSDCRVESGKGSATVYLSADTIELIKESQVIMGGTVRFDLTVKRYSRPDGTDEKTLFSKGRTSEAVTRYTNCVFTNLPDITITNKKNGVEQVSFDFVYERAIKESTFHGVPGNDNF